MTSSASTPGPSSRGRLAWLFGGQSRNAGHDGGGATTRAAQPVDAVLIVSDLHLGEGAKDRRRIDFLKRTDVEDREFCRFLEYHRAYRPEGRPWQLVLAGDVFDLLAAVVTPDPKLTQDRWGFTLDSHEHHGELDNSEAKVAWKLDRILDRHPSVVSYLADFVGSGNSLVLLCGNHDAELYWPRVQQRLLQRLVEAYFGDEQADGTTRDEFTARVTFRCWLHQVPGLVHVQHGHQYDAYCSQQRPLYPRRPGREELLELSQTALLIRYGLARVHGVRSHGLDGLTFPGYLRWLWAMPASTSGRLVAAYFHALWEQVRYWTALRGCDTGPLDQAQRLALGREAELVGLPGPALAAIAALQQPPANHGYRSIVSSMFFDTLATVTLAPVLLLLWLLLGPRGWRRLVGAGALLGGTVLALRKFSAHRRRTLSPRLREAALQLAPLVGTPFVAMGHTHAAELLPLGTGATFINTGCWLRHDDPERQHGEHCDCQLLYAELRRDEANRRAVARLQRWCAQRGQPETLEQADQPLSDERPISPQPEERERVGLGN